PAASGARRARLAERSRTAGGTPPASAAASIGGGEDRPGGHSTSRSASRWCRSRSAVGFDRRKLFVPQCGLLVDTREGDQYILRKRRADKLQPQGEVVPTEPHRNT